MSDISHTVETVRRRVRPITPLRYAGASMDFNPIHLFEDAAQAAGFERGPVLHGMCLLTWIADAIEHAANAPLVELSCRFAHSVCVGDTVLIVPERQDGGWTARAMTTHGDEVARSIKASPQPIDPTNHLAHLPAGGLREEASYTIGGEKIREFREAAKVPGPEDVAPLTFAAVVCRQAVFTLLARPEIGLEENGIVHAAQRMRCDQPLRAGDVLKVTAALLEDTVRHGLHIVSIRSVISNEGAMVVGGADWTLARRV